MTGLGYVTDKDLVVYLRTRYTPCGVRYVLTMVKTRLKKLVATGNIANFERSEKCIELERSGSISGSSSASMLTQNPVLCSLIWLFDIKRGMI